MDDMDEQENGASTETDEQTAVSGAAAAGGEVGQQKQGLPASVHARISELTRKRREAEARAEQNATRAAQLEAELAAARAGNGGGDAAASASAAPRAVTHQEVERLADELAEKKLRVRQHDESVRRIDTEGRREFQDFDTVISNFSAIGGIPPAVFSAIAKLPDAHRVIYALANDLDKAAMLFGEDPVSVGMELAQMTGKAAPKKQQLTKVGEPIESTSGRSSAPDVDPDSMDNDAWFAWRESQLKGSR